MGTENDSPADDTVVEDVAATVAPGVSTDDVMSALRGVDGKLDTILEHLTRAPSSDSGEESGEDSGEGSGDGSGDATPHDDEDKDKTPDPGPWTHRKLFVGNRGEH